MKFFLKMQDKHKKLYESIMTEVNEIIHRRLSENVNDGKFNMDALNNPENNIKISQKYPNFLKCKQSPDKSYIGVTMEIKNNQDDSDSVEITIYGKTFINLIERVSVIFLAPMCLYIHNIPKFTFNVIMDKEFENMWKKVWRTFSSDKQDEYDDFAQALYFYAFEKATSAADVAAKIKTFKM